MKRNIVVRIALVLILATNFFLLLFNLEAFAVNGPHQGPGYLQNTDACALCHRSHTGTASRLLFVGANRFEFCTYCHNGDGAQTNVVSGEFEGTARPRSTTYYGYDSLTDGEPGMGLNGGGFVSAVPYTGRQSRAQAPILLNNLDNNPVTPTTDPDLQRHNVAGSDSYVGPAWGGGYSDGGIPGPSIDIQGFTCTSCHDPHGTRNSDGTERYRILKGTPLSPVNARVTTALRTNEIDVWGKHDYTRDAYRTGIASFCTSCHTQYLTMEGTIDQYGNPDADGAYDAGDGQGPVKRYRHKLLNLIANIYPPISGQGPDVFTNLRNSWKLPLEQPAGYQLNYQIGDWQTCLTCHQAHGSSANMDDLPGSVAPAYSSTLLRVNNRGVCQACHNK